MISRPHATSINAPRHASSQATASVDEAAIHRLLATQGLIDQRSGHIASMQSMIRFVDMDDRIRQSFEKSVMSDDLRAKDERVLAASGLGLAAGIDRPRIQEARGALLTATLTTALCDENMVEKVAWIPPVLSTETRMNLVSRIMAVAFTPSEPRRQEAALRALARVTAIGEEIL